MQFTRKGDYALKAMVYLADAKSKGPHTIDEISENSNVPRHFLAKILKDLTRANLLIAVKGARGGYVLARASGEINLLQIIEAVVGPLALNLCLEADDRCSETQTCGLYPVWRKASEAITHVFENADLDSVCRGR